MIDKFLQVFGLMRISEAKHISKETTALYCRAIAGLALKDFGMPINPIGEEDARTWAGECFDQMMKEGPDKKLVGAWEL